MSAGDEMGSPETNVCQDLSLNPHLLPTAALPTLPFTPTFSGFISPESKQVQRRLIYPVRMLVQIGSIGQRKGLESDR